MFKYMVSLQYVQVFISSFEQCTRCLVHKCYASHVLVAEQRLFFGGPPCGMFFCS